MKKNKGFTLVEIIVTVVILAILMAVAVPVSLSYMDDIHDQRMLSEGESVLAVAQSRISRLSLAGEYNEELTAEGKYYLPTETRKEIVEKANGKGTLNELIYYNGKVTGMRYYIDNRYVVLQEHGKDLYLDTHSTPNDIAELIANSSSTFKDVYNYFRSKNNLDCVDSQAPSKTTDPSKAGIGDKVRIYLVNQGVDINNTSWCFIKHGTNNDTAQFELLIYDGNIGDDEKFDRNKKTEITAITYMFNAKGEMLKDESRKDKTVYVMMHPDKTSKYMVMRLSQDAKN